MEGNKLNPFTVLKSPTSSDVSQAGGVNVNQKYETTSTASQTSISLGFSVPQDAKNSFELFIDGKIKREGLGNDYTFSDVQSGLSSTITLASSLSAGLDIKAVLFGIRENAYTNSPISGPLGIGVGTLSADKVADYTITDADKNSIIAVDLSSISITITLHTPSTSPFFITIKDIKGNAVNNNLIVYNSAGAIDGISDTDTMNEPYSSTSYVWDGVKWNRVAFFSGNSYSGIAVFAGGYTGSNSNVMDYVTIDSTGNATDFGDLTVARIHCPGVASSTRGVFMGGYSVTEVGTMDYIAIASASNASLFGTLAAVRDGAGAVSSSTRGVMGGGNGGPTSAMFYITIATLGNGDSFGNLSIARRDLSGCQSPTRGVFGGDLFSSIVMDHITIATLGNALNFGNMSVAKIDYGSLSNPTRGVFGGGDIGGSTAVMDYITIATLGNATNFGNLSVSRLGVAGASNVTRGIFGGGYTGSYSSVMDYITISTLGNATNFGNLTVARARHGSLSNSHGGL